MDKRRFLKTITLAGMVAPITGKTAIGSWIEAHSNTPANLLAEDESFWEGIRAQYLLKPDYINLENGYYNILPKEILEAYLQHIRDVNYQGSYYMRTVQFDNKNAMAAKVAEIVGCTTEELVLTRNTTESLDMIIGGFPWQKGDEAIYAEQDYGAMIQMFKQVEKRNGIVCKVLSIPHIPASDDELVNLYANAITPKTKLILLSHMINITGQILPVKKICDMAHSKGVEVMVDGAHAIAHIQFQIPNLNCDYYGASLHKWLCVPLGVGILYVKKDKINKIWPLLAEGENIESIKRLNHLGTHPVHTDLAITNAVDFYKQLGPAKKEARLRYLQLYWTSKVRNLPNIELYTPSDPNRSCAIANVGIKGMKPDVMAATLLKKYQIYTVAIDGANVHGCRITPNIYTTIMELDSFVAALKEMSSIA
ncbi:MAG: aminotransferase class V-fold PLP-dependent enzyme [Sediminibacterium sp.]|nr:aminotransferase class V-fold PLP-dependent enzyme [Sediminibacterium sp.]